MIEDRNNKFNRDRGLIERNYGCQLPQHREAFDYFRSFGILLPMSSMNAQLNVANMLILHPEHGWCLDHGSNPLYGWPMKKVLSTNKYDVPENDLYGRLYFYIADRINTLISLMKTNRLKFHIYQQDAIDLLKQFKNKNMQFDRIDVSNISDENYVGLDACLKLSKPLLKVTNPCSKLITTFMNWTARTEFGLMSNSLNLIKGGRKEKD